MSTVQPALLSAREVCTILNISKPGLYVWIRKGQFPQGCIVGPRLRFWPRELVEEFIRSKTANAAALRTPPQER